MKIRKFNIDRMRRNVARSTPDVISRKIDPRKEEYLLEYRDWINRFGHKMLIKHKKHVNINVSYDEDRLSRLPSGEVLVTAHVSKIHNDPYS